MPVQVPAVMVTWIFYESKYTPKIIAICIVHACGRQKKNRLSFFTGDINKRGFNGVLQQIIIDLAFLLQNNHNFNN